MHVRSHFSIWDPPTSGQWVKTRSRPKLLKSSITKPDLHLCHTRTNIWPQYATKCLIPSVSAWSCSNAKQTCASRPAFSFHQTDTALLSAASPHTPFTTRSIFDSFPPHRLSQHWALYLAQVNLTLQHMWLGFPHVSSFRFSLLKTPIKMGVFVCILHQHCIYIQTPLPLLSS